jgi:hypothetical protein
MASVQGVNSSDVPPFNNIIHINDPNQIAAGIISAAKPAIPVVVITGDIVMTASRSAGQGSCSVMVLQFHEQPFPLSLLLLPRRLAGLP